MSADAQADAHLEHPQGSSQSGAPLAEHPEIDRSFEPIARNVGSVGAPQTQVVPIRAIPGVNVLGLRRFVEFSSVADATLVETDKGARPARELKPGDLVQTLDNGLQPLVWTSMRASPATQPGDDATPVRIVGNALGNDRPTRPVVVAPDQKLLIDCPQCEALLGHRRILVAARNLLHLDGVDRALVADQPMVHLMRAAREVLNIGGIWVDSFSPIDPQLNGLCDDQRRDLLATCPRLQFAAGQAAFVMSLPTLNASEAATLL
ncbi:MAG: hypothetical protein GKR99_12325 [Rhodobacteraceae bacterium]|nr:hypothetical protein [Paracoccaceae bacterium]